MSDDGWTQERSSAAEDDLDGLSPVDQDRILDKLDEIVSSPQRDPPDYDEPLQNSPYKKIRVGEFRLSVSFRQDDQWLVVARIKRRGGAYTADDDQFEIAAHLDLVERNPALQGFATESHYRQVAEALQSSRTVTKLNAGGVLDGYGEFHPSPAFLDVLSEYDIAVTIGTDLHTPEALTDRIPLVDDWFETVAFEPVELSVQTRFLAGLVPCL